MPATLLVRLPEGVSERVAAALMLKGLTVQYLFRQTRRLERGETILFHAAAGGVGLIACQWARALGVKMIGTVGSDDKAALARAHGCAHTIVYTRESFVDRVREITHGEGVPVVYDGVGKETFPASLDCLAHAAECSWRPAPRAPYRRSIFRCWRRRARSTRHGLCDLHPAARGYNRERARPDPIARRRGAEAHRDLSRIAEDDRLDTHCCRSARATVPLPQPPLLREGDRHAEPDGRLRSHGRGVDTPSTHR
jgi:hypothetical protein